MSLTEISEKNISNSIDIFKADIIRYEQLFECIEKNIVELECRCQRNKFDMKERFSNINQELLIELVKLCKLQSFLDDKDILREELQIDFARYFGVLNKTEDTLRLLKEVQKDIGENTQFKEFTSIDASPNTSTLNPHLVRCRQTKRPFILTLMQPGSRHMCNGCREQISLQHLYLKHLEEYPAGSQRLIPHSYHINKKCICDRGFQESYLSTMEVICEESITEGIRENLLDIGFMESNIRTKDDSDCESNDSDAMSQHSGASKEPSQTTRFTLRRQPINQKKKLVCSSCEDRIMVDSFLTCDNTPDQVFHIKQKCIQSLSCDFSRAKCKVYKLLRNHGEFKQLLACGFYYKNIIGFRPRDTFNKKIIPAPILRQMSFTKPIFKDLLFLFNDEPFGCQQLEHGERCQGCYEFMVRAEMALRHKECVPRETLAEIPLVTQYYHCSKKCLSDRGFTPRYMESSACHVILAGHENYQKMKDCLVKCGFSNDKMSFCTTYDNKSLEKEIISMGFPRSALTHKRLKFVVDDAAGISDGCGACRAPLQRDKYILRVVTATEGRPTIKSMHLTVDCVRKCGYTENILAQNTLTLYARITPAVRDMLEQCGFRNIPAQ